MEDRARSGRVDFGIIGMNHVALAPSEVNKVSLETDLRKASLIDT